MAKKKRPQPQPSNDPSQMILGIVIGAVFSAVVTSGIFLISGSGGGGSSSSETVAMNSDSGQSDSTGTESAVPVPTGGGLSGAGGASSGQGASGGSAGMSAEMEMQMAGNAGGSGESVPPGSDAAMSAEMEMEMAGNAGGSGGAIVPPGDDAAAAMSPEMSANQGSSGGAPAPFGGINSGAGDAPSAAMSPEMANPGLGGATIPGGATVPGGEGFAGLSNPDGSGISSSGGSGVTGKADPLFLAELEKIEVSEDDLKLPDLIERVEPSVVRINTRSSEGYGVGSGYVVSKSGLVVTNYHVIEGIKEASVEFSDGSKGEVTGYRYFDPNYDIAIIQIEVSGKELVPLPLASEVPKKGSSVVAFGAPHGLSFTTTEGIISAIRTQDEMQDQMGVELKGTWLQTSTPISPGNSGGPLVNMRGQVVAMNTMQMTIGQNLNFAVSSADVLTLAKAGSGKKVVKLDPKKLKPVSRDIKRKLAKNIQGTDRGNELLSKIDEIWLLLVYQRASIDPTSQLKNSVYAHAKQAIEKTGIQLSFGEPSGDAAVMIVTLKTNMVRKAAPGTQMVVVDAFLILEDPEEKSNNKFVKVWSVDEVEIGTVALQAIARGLVPRSFGTKLTSFFNKFKTAQSRAKRALKVKKG